MDKLHNVISGLFLLAFASTVGWGVWDGAVSWRIVFALIVAFIATNVAFGVAKRMLQKPQARRFAIEGQYNHQEGVVVMARHQNLTRKSGPRVEEDFFGPKVEDNLVEYGIRYGNEPEKVHKGKAVRKDGRWHFYGSPTAIRAAGEYFANFA